MSREITLALPADLRATIAHRLPDWAVPVWFASREEGLAVASGAEVGWLDLVSRAAMSELIEAATSMRWFNTLYTGLDALPLETMRRRSVVVTNGSGLAGIPIAEYIVMAVLTMAKGFRSMMRAQERHEWLSQGPAQRELAGSRALLIGFGGIGQLVKPRLEALQVEVFVARRSGSGEDGFLGPGQWRPRLGEFDWVILAVPATADTLAMFGADEFKLMKPSAVLLNFARGSLVDTDALVDALNARTIGGAFLDVTQPEPLPPDHPLWSLDTVNLSMHLSGRTIGPVTERSVQRFLHNLDRYANGQPLTHTVDLTRGY